MKKTAVVGIAAGLALLAGACGYFLLPKDMTGSSYSEISAYEQAHPYKPITYTVTIHGGDTPLELTAKDRLATITHKGQVESLIAQAAYLQHLTEIDLSPIACTAAQRDALQMAFPETLISYWQVDILGKTYEKTASAVDLSTLNSENLPQALSALSMMTALERVDLGSNVALDDAAALHDVFPHLQYDYTVELFGQTLSTDMETVEYFQVPIYDEGLAEFRKLLPMMHKLTYFKLDWCETSDEAMAQLREDFAPQGIKVVWRVFFARMNALTDTYKIWASWSMNDYITEPLKYCNEVKYLDLGHAFYTNIEFVKYMPDLEVCILSDSDFVDLEPIRHCKKLTFLEMLTCFVKDLSPLEDLENLEYLNISNLPIESIEPLYELPNLKRVWCTMVRLPQEQVDTFRQLHPDCETIFNVSGDPTDYGWRYIYKEGVGKVKHPRYALLTEQFGYERWDYSQYPKGYVREEITYESTGIDPM